MIRRIRIRGFRSLHDVDVELSPTTVLVGRSGTGKSNFLRALQALRSSVAGGTPVPQPGQSSPDFWSIPPVMEKGSRQMSFEAELVPSDGPAMLYSLAYELGGRSGYHSGPTIKEERLEAGGTVIFARQGNKFAKSPPVAGAEGLIQNQGASPILSKLAGVEETSVAYLLLVSGLAVYNFPLGVLSMPPNRQDKSITRGLKSDGGNYLSVLDAMFSSVEGLQQWRQVVTAVTTLNRSVNTITVARPNANNVSVSHDIGDGTRLLFDLGQESEGFRRFLAHMLALYQQPPKSTLGFEEPENGIFPAALATLAEEFKAAPQEGRGQVIITTHSPQLLDAFDADSIRVVEMDADLHTRIGPMADSQREALKDHLMTPGEMMIADPFRLHDAEPAGEPAGVEG